MTFDPDIGRTCIEIHREGLYGRPDGEVAPIQHVHRTGEVIGQCD